MSYRGLGDDQSDCNRLKDPAANGGICTPEDIVAFIKWKAGMAADYARTSAAQAANPATIIVGALAWLSPSTQLSMLFGHTPQPPALYYVGAALPLVALYLFFGGRR